MKDYQNYTVEELASDQKFIQWLQDPHGEKHTFWQSWINQQPENAEKARQAKKLVSRVQFTYYPIEEKAKQRIWTAIQSEKNSPATHHTFYRQLSNRYRYVGIAASIAIVLVVSYIFWRTLNPNWNEETTAYGETKEIVLPDSTVIMLNANTTLRWPRSWPTSGQREVWLKGEAYFDVKQIENSGQDTLDYRPFMVHLDETEIKVLGTTFNVFHRRENIQVVLNSGKVQLTLSKAYKEINMVPGDMVEISGDQQQVSQKRVDPANYSAWKENKLVFNHHTLEEIATYLQDIYGYEVFIEPESLKTEKFSGSTPTDQLEVLFLSLESSFNVNIVKHKNTIMIKKKNPPGP